jgi:uncharacterized protein (TIGR02117 family)
MLVSILIVFLNIFSASIQDNAELDTSEIKIFLVKQRWHTGIVIETAKVDTAIWKEINHFKEYKYVDVGWGDEAFYQHPGFDLELAVKALFYPTPSTLQLEGFNLSIEEYAEISDIAIELKISCRQFEKIIQYINDAYWRNAEGNVHLQLERYGGSIKFYKANGNYHIFNTCNAWIARALNEAGLNIPDDPIFAEELFKQAQHFGRLLKSE